jgi:hypothetical protein
MREIASGLRELERLVRPELMVMELEMELEDIQFECG